MSAISKVLREADGGLLMFYCPGCKEIHQIRHGTGPGPRWGYNGNPDKPSFTPSVLVTGVKQMTDEQHEAYLRTGVLPEAVPMRCHSYVTDGRIQFLGDCTHELAGKTVDLPEKWEPGK